MASSALGAMTAWMIRHRLAQLRLAVNRSLAVAWARRCWKPCVGVVCLAGLLWLVVYLLGWPRQNSVERLHLYRDLYDQEAWPQVERGDSLTPLQVPRTVHYLWCGRKEFQFRHYLGVLSALRLLRPIRLVFHYTHLPLVDDRWYNVWFQELKQSLAGLELELLPLGQSCHPQDLLIVALDLLAPAGGLYLSEGTLLTRFPAHATSAPLWFTSSSGGAASADGVMVMSQAGFAKGDAARYLEVIAGGQGSATDWADGGHCATVTQFNQRAGQKSGRADEGGGGGDRTAPCVVLTEDVHPRDIWATKTAFAKLARWLFYGKKQLRLPAPGPADRATPRVGHVTWLKPSVFLGTPDFRFLTFLSVLSALHVAGLRHVYVHGDLTPAGRWWEELRGQNVSFVPMEAPAAVFQQDVSSRPHRSDLARIQILQEHGGVYFDADVVWSGPLPDTLLRFPTVLSPDWPRSGAWPESFNLGVVLAQARAPWLRHYLLTLRHFLDDDHVFNSVLMSYRVYERHPETVYVDRYLQTICFDGVCHPAWHDDYIRDFDDTRPLRDFDWRDSRSFHFTFPKPPPSLQSPQAIAAGSDLYAELGRHVLAKAGRLDLLLDKD